MQKAEKQNVMKDKTPRTPKWARRATQLTCTINMEDSPLICRKGLNTMLLTINHCYYDRVVAIIFVTQKGSPLNWRNDFIQLYWALDILFLDIITLGVIPHCWYLTWFFTGVTIFFVLQSTVSGRASLPVNGNFKLPSVLFAMLTLDR